MSERGDGGCEVGAMSGYYGRDGSPCTMEEWVTTWSNDWRVAFDDIDGHQISTVYFGLNHRFGDGPPLIFETMIFGGAFDQEAWRYSTEAEALEGHAAAVKRVRERGC